MKRAFVIAEAGVNHNGSVSNALRLVEAAAGAGADAVKFQTFRAESLVARGTASADYQRTTTGVNDQFALLKGLELSRDDHEVLAQRCGTLGIEFMSTPFDAESADFLIGLGMRRIKIPSGELTNLPLLVHVARSAAPLIVSTGMATIEEVGEAVQCIRSVRRDSLVEEDLALLHCTSSYPAVPGDVNLRAMLTMRERFGVPVGYSDHTLGIHISVAAAALGAEFIEKHLTLDRSMPGPDHCASLEPVEFGEMVRSIREVSEALGDGIKAPRTSEIAVRNLVRRSVVANDDLPCGHVLRVNDVQLLRPGTGIPPRDLEKVIGRKINRAIRRGEILRWQDLG